MTSAASAGCRRLIRDFDAVCVTTPDEMAGLAPLDGAMSAPDGHAAFVSSERTRVIDALSTRSPRGIEDVAARAGLSIGQTQSVLGMLELDGRVAESDRGWVMRR